MEWEWYTYIIVILAGIGAGFINTLAGSGSLITLAVLTFLGLPANIANGTNRVGVLFQNIIATESFRRQNVLDTRGGLILSLPAILGSLLGAQIAVELDEETMRQVIGILMVVMLVVIIVQPKKWLEGKLEQMEKRPSWWQLLIFFCIGIYGGFIQAGVGIFLLAALVLSIGYNLLRANPVKNMIVLIFTISALIIFVLNDQVIWSIGFLLAIGNSTGAWIASKMAVKRGAGFVRYILIAVVVVSAANLLGIFTRIGQFFS